MHLYYFTKREFTSCSKFKCNRTITHMINEIRFSSYFRFNTSKYPQSLTKFGICRKLSSNKSDIDISLNLANILRAFRTRGHLAAQIDPLSYMEADKKENRTWRFHVNKKNKVDIVQLISKSEFDLDVFGLENIDVNKEYYLGKEVRIRDKSYWKIIDFINYLKDAYCGSVGVEYMHIDNDEEINWLESKIEGKLGPLKWSDINSSEKLNYLSILQKTHLTAEFLGKKFSSAKVFGIEGSEALVVSMWAIFQRSSEMGIEGIEMGMAHRGRMNILQNVLGKSLSSICNQFNESEHNISDVKYHLGTRAEIQLQGEGGNLKKLHVSLAANPSHLEAVNSVVIGKTKATQFYVGDHSMDRIIPLIIHGDASFSGQGIVSEVLELSNHPDYTVGGCIHVIVNNQVGFTTNPREVRYSYQCTNVAKGIEVPIFHVNGDDVDAVVSVSKLAVEWRQRFKKDCVIDIVGYRRHGHNNLDDPRITQPLTYSLIDNHPPIFNIYSDKLISQGIITESKLKEWKQAIEKDYEMDYLKSKSYIPDPAEWLASNWQGKAIGSLVADRPYNQTGVDLNILKQIGLSLTQVPDDMALHEDIKRLLEVRKQMIESERGITMAFAEALAFGCLMAKFSPDETDNISSSNQSSITKMEAHPTVHIRLSGQDCVRGTFNQRHASIVCQKTSRSFCQLNNLNVKEQATISVCNSHLSEAAVLGFEYGYSLSNEMALTLWEAQFGDFANVAQSIIDNFIVSGENKWSNYSSLVMLLPHGYDGQGPEHSSARLERFLQLVDDDPDEIPGKGVYSKAEIEAGYEKLLSGAENKNEGIDKKMLTQTLLKYAPHATTERIDIAIAELLNDLNQNERDNLVTEGTKFSETNDFKQNFKDYLNNMNDADAKLSKSGWCELMTAWLQRNSEQRHNMSVVYPSTPAQYFHVLRRQIHRHYAKPLVVMSPKWLLHHKSCTSDLADMGPGTYFQRLIIEGSRGDNMLTKSKKQGIKFADPMQIEKIIFCTGKIFYHLYHHRTAKLTKDNDSTQSSKIIIARLEQIAPFPYDLISPFVERYPNARLIWVQEEPKNMGAWGYIKPRFDTLLRDIEAISGHKRNLIDYIGRNPSASPATGSYKTHGIEQSEILEKAIS